MKVEIHRQRVPWDEPSERMLRRAVRSMDARARRYPDYWSELDIHVDEVEGGLEEIKLSLVLAGHEIVVDRYGKDVPALIEDAFSELFRQFDGYRLAANRTLRQRVDRRLARGRNGAALPIRGEGPKRQLVMDLYPVLLRVAQHEVAVRQIEGDLEPGLVDPVELVDMVLAEGLPAIDPDMTVPQAVARLQNHLVEILQETVLEIHEHSGTDVSLDADIRSNGNAFAVSGLGEEIQDLWAPREVDEMLLEEVFSDPAAINPEVFWTRRELRDTMVHALFRLPDDRRRIFSQVVIDGWVPDAVAAALERDQAEVEGEVTAAARDIARALSTRAIVWSSDRVVEVFEALRHQLHDERRDLRGEVGGG
ncbi:MAG: hypothetical protein JRI25_02800 [Deltaproteobacteria bacterium]|nr:hypothetical protein [Deltaproteobacteria bacterium]MBW2253511.1 hypothetical protein [Deltaproteobacteria bacterium]